jgi:hypothetical protein
MRLMASSLSGLARSGGPRGTGTVQRVYRLVDRQGNPHPVLDDLYDTLEAAWNEALSWWQEQRPSGEPMEIGVEVSTSCGSWRTLRHPGVCL